MYFPKGFLAPHKDTFQQYNLKTTFKIILYVWSLLFEARFYVSISLKNWLKKYWNKKRTLWNSYRLLSTIYLTVLNSIKVKDTLPFSCNCWRLISPFSTSAVCTSSLSCGFFIFNSRKTFCKEWNTFQVEATATFRHIYSGTVVLTSCFSMAKRTASTSSNITLCILIMFCSQVNQSEMCKTDLSKLLAKAPLPLGSLL